MRNHPVAGNFYLHPEDGLIHITGGFYTDPSNGRLSNHFSWTVVKTGESKSGYAGEWEKVDCDVEIVYRVNLLSQTGKRVLRYEMDY